MEEKQNLIQLAPKSFYLLTFLVILTFLLTLFNTYTFLFPKKITGFAISDDNAQAPSLFNNETNLSIFQEPPILGNKDAPITIIEFLDYECSFSKKHFTQSYPKILEDYVQKGKAKIIFIDFPLPNHKNSQKASEAAYCVREQLGDEGYFTMHNLLFENQNNLSLENILNLGYSLNLNNTKFYNCLENGKYSEIINANIKEGIEKGVKGTPTLFINEKIVEGAQPYIKIKNILDSFSS